MQKLLLVLTLALALSCGGGAATPTPTTPTPTPVEPETPAQPETPAGAKPPAGGRVLAADETITTPSGTTMTASAGWTVHQDGNRVTLTTPEGDLTVTHVEVQAADRAGAIAAAWALVQPDFKLAEAQAVDVPARDGWDAIGQVIYVTPAAEKRVVVAVARLKGKTWYVQILDGSQAAVDRRGAQLGTALTSLKVPGLEKERFAGKPARPLDAARLAELDAFVEEAMRLGDVPGAAIAVVHGGKIIHERGYGVRSKGKPQKVDQHTLFMIGSTTKSLTTIMMARLVDQGVFTWDTPVTQVLPGFALGDDKTTGALLMRHTVCACTGMPRQDLEFLFEFAKLSPEDRLATMKTMVPTTGFGETFQYSNLLVSAGGFAAAHARAPELGLGPAYDQAMAELVFKPLGMKTTTFDFKRVAKANHASPHFLDMTATPSPMPVTAEAWVVAVRPAGAAWSSVHEMAQVLLLELAGGRFAGKQLVSEAAFMARRQPQVKISDESAYGLGLFIEESYGVKSYGHGGNTGGFTADFYFFPEHDVGVVFLTNAGAANAVRGAVQRRVYELLFDGKPEALEDLKDSRERLKKDVAEQYARIEQPPDKEWFEPLIGVWEAPGLGRIELERDKAGRAIFDAGEWKVAAGKLTGKDGTISLITVGPELAGIEVIPREQDGRIVLVLDAGQHSYVFEKVAKK